jgi:hypothetical protein
MQSDAMDPRSAWTRQAQARSDPKGGIFGITSKEHRDSDLRFAWHPLERAQQAGRSKLKAGIHTFISLLEN